MKRVNALFIFSAILFLSLFYTNCSAYTWSYLEGDLEYGFSGWFKPEMFYGNNISLLNSNNQTDKVWFMRHTLDCKFFADYGKITYEFPVVNFSFTVRDKGIWGNPASIASTTEAETRLLDAVARRHKHGIPRHIFWMREGWLQFDLNTFLMLPFKNHHSFKLGIFAFELGRGIALGDAYAVGLEILGFYTDANVDQYAPGAKLSGFIVKDVLSYDLYAAILNNKSSSLLETAEKVLGQQYGRLKTPWRGFGKINFAIAGRLNWTIFNNEQWGRATLEPYGLFNSDPEQFVEFPVDASSKLGTIGFAGEYYGNKFEFGFDYALNLGQQRVKGWDRNQIKEENRGGFVVLSNSHVVDQTGKKILFTSSSSNAQKIIYNTFQDESQNGQQIGVDGTTTLINAANRFRNPYTNKFEGWMFVCDGSYWIYKRDVQVSLAAGIATGDENPNEETKDGVYSGFIGLQEIYSGKRVRSAFVLGGAGKLRRPLSAPEDPTQLASPFAQVVNGFTNLVFCGGSVKWKPSHFKHAFNVMPNILAYWQEKPSKKFDALTNTQLDHPADTFLGVETNIFVDFYPMQALRMYFVGSIFFPGGHYRDVRGLPLNAEQNAILDQLDETGFSADKLPNLGDDLAYTLNLGIEFRF